MKVTILLLSAVVCFAAVNAAISEQSEPTLNLEEIFADEITDFEERGFFGGLFWILKAALRTIKGINCVIKEMEAIKVGCQDFINDIYKCGTDAVQPVKNVIIGAKSIQAACNDVINTFQKYCLSANGKPNPTYLCKWKLTRGVLKVKKEINKTMKDIKKIPAVPGEASVCSNDAFSEFVNLITSLSSKVYSCSKLTN